MKIGNLAAVSSRDRAAVAAGRPGPARRHDWYPAILGNGDVALIIDVSVLVSHHAESQVARA